MGWEDRYQSIDCGGSSLEWEVLTVSTQPGRGSRSQPIILGKRSLGKSRVGRWEAGDERAEHTWDWEFSLSFQEGRVGIDKLLCLDSMKKAC